MRNTTKQSLQTQLDQLLLQRQRYRLATDAATSVRAIDRHTRTLQRLHDEIAGLQEALRAVGNRPEDDRSGVQVPAPPVRHTAANDTVPAARHATATQDAGVWWTPPLPDAPRRLRRPAAKHTIGSVVAKLPEPPRPTSGGLFDTRASLPIPRGLSSRSHPRRPDDDAPTPARPASRCDTAWPAADPDGVAPELRRPAIDARRRSAGPRSPRPRVTDRSTVTVSANDPPAARDTPPRRATDDRPAQPSRADEPQSTRDIRTSTDETQIDAVMLRRRIALQAAKIMTSAFAVGFVLAAFAV